MSSRSKSQRAGILAVALLAGLSVRLDDIYYRRPLDKWAGIDWGMMSEVFMSNAPVTVDHYNDFWIGAGGKDAGSEEPGGKRVGAAAPIRWGGEVRGALSIVRESDPVPFDETDLELVSRLADLSAIALEQTEMHERLEIAHASGVDALTAAIDLRDKYTWKHSHNVMKLAEEVARRLELDEAALAEISLAARLHDLGKIGVPDSILL